MKHEQNKEKNLKTNKKAYYEYRKNQQRKGGT